MSSPVISWMVNITCISYSPVPLAQINSWQANLAAPFFSASPWGRHTNVFCNCLNRGLAPTEGMTFRCPREPFFKFSYGKAFARLLSVKTESPSSLKPFLRLKWIRTSVCLFFSFDSPLTATWLRECYEVVLIFLCKMSLFYPCYLLLPFCFVLLRNVRI